MSRIYLLDRKTDRQTQTETDRQTKMETDRQTKSGTDRQTDRDNRQRLMIKINRQINL